jgi:predicted GNAT family acetyltransferase
LLRGTDAGKKLVKAGVEFAREHNLTVLPLCPFAKAIINKTPEFQDVLK